MTEKTHLFTNSGLHTREHTHTLQHGSTKHQTVEEDGEEIIMKGKGDKGPTVVNSEHVPNRKMIFLACGHPCVTSPTFDDQRARA